VLKGISVGMKKHELRGNWGYPAKRETKNKIDVWYYLNQNTPNPTDGLIVYFYKEKVKDWKIVDNVYKEMRIWGKEAGISP